MIFIRDKTLEFILRPVLTTSIATLTTTQQIISSTEWFSPTINCPQIYSNKQCFFLCLLFTLLCLNVVPSLLKPLSVIIISVLQHRRKCLERPHRWQSSQSHEISNTVRRCRVSGHSPQGSVINFDLVSVTFISLLSFLGF